MDLDSIEGLNEIRPAVYRAAMKLRSLQKLCHMHMVSLRELQPALGSLGESWERDAVLDRQEVTRALNRMYHSVSQEVPGQVTLEAPEQTCRLIYKLYDRSQSGFVCRRSVEVALISLSADTLSAKHRALVCVAEWCSDRRLGGAVSRSSLRAVLQDLSQVPSAVQEGRVFGLVEAAVKSCFSGVLTPSVSEDHVLSWLQADPCLLLWLSTLYRLTVSENVTHSVRCHTCKDCPITGLRYRCMKCVNVHLCQTCFLTDRQTKKHKTTHPVLEHCTQPSWRESLSSLTHSACHALLPRRYTRREAERRRGLVRVSSEQLQANSRTPDSSPQSSYSSPQPAAPPSSLRPHPRHAPAPSPPPPPPSSSSPRVSSSPSRLPSKTQPTEEEEDEDEEEEEEEDEEKESTPQRGALLKDVRDLQRDKWLLERELQAWRVSVQSEQGILEDRCSEMEVTMDTLRQHNLRLQGMLTEALSRTHQHASVKPHERDTPGAPPSPGGGGEERGRVEEEEYDRDDLEEDEEESELAFIKDEESEEERREEERSEEEWREGDVNRGEGRTETGLHTETPSPTIQWGTKSTEDEADHIEEREPVVDGRLSGQITDRWFVKEAGFMVNKHLSRPVREQHVVGAEAVWNGGPLSGPLAEQCSTEEEDHGICSPVELEEQLEELVHSLKADLSQHSHTVNRLKTELLRASEGVGDSVHCLVSAVSNTHTLRP